MSGDLTVSVGDEALDPEMLRQGLGRSVFAGNIVYRKTLDSTSNLAKEMALRGAPHGTLVLTEEQSAGRGRRGRFWISPGRSNLLFSVLLRPPLEPEKVFVLTMILALAASDAIKTRAGVSALIKWPNDLYVGGMKLAGILTEFSMREGSLEYVILGVGLNVNWNPGEYAEVSDIATSVMAEAGRTIPRGLLLVEILKRFEDSLFRVLGGEIDPFYRRWNELSLVIGRDVLIESDEEKICGRAIRIDRSGALIIQDEQGSERRIINGDVSLRWVQ